MLRNDHPKPPVATLDTLAPLTGKAGTAALAALASTAALAALAALAGTALLLAAGPAQAQFEAYPRLGFSAAADRHEPSITVHGDEVFELHVIVLPPEGEASLEHDFATFHWAVMQVCCGGAATILDEDFNPACQSDGELLDGVVTTFEDCAGGEVVHIATLTMRMAVDASGQYVLIAAPLSQAIACDGQLVVMTDMMVTVDYTADSASGEASSWSGVRALFAP